MSNRKVAGNYCIDSTLSYHARGFPGIIRFRQRGGHHNETNGLPALSHRHRRRHTGPRRDRGRRELRSRRRGVFLSGRHLPREQRTCVRVGNPSGVRRAVRRGAAGRPGRDRRRGHRRHLRRVDSRVQSVDRANTRGSTGVPIEPNPGSRRQRAEPGHVRAGRVGPGSGRGRLRRRGRRGQRRFRLSFHRLEDVPEGAGDPGPRLAHDYGRRLQQPQDQQRRTDDGADRRRDDSDLRAGAAGPVDPGDRRVPGPEPFPTEHRISRRIRDPPVERTGKPGRGRLDRGGACLLRIRRGAARLRPRGATPGQHLHDQGRRSQSGRDVHRLGTHGQSELTHEQQQLRARRRRRRIGNRSGARGRPGVRGPDGSHRAFHTIHSLEQRRDRS